MIKPLGDMILVLADEDVPGMTPGGIHLPKQMEQQIDTATVIRAGEGKKDDKGELIPMLVKEGDKVLIAKASGLSIYVDGKKCKMMPSTQVLGVIVE